MSLSPDQRLELIQWIAALPPAQFDGLVFSLGPPPGTLSSAPAAIGTRAAELLNWAQSVLGPGISAVVVALRSAVASVAPQKLGEFDAAFSDLQSAGEAEKVFPVAPQKLGEFDAAFSDLQSAGEAEKVFPYQGLEAFTPATQRFFYGRQGTVDLLLKKLTEFNFVPVIGASGSGKSSVVRAGLIPSLGDTWQVLEPITPDEEPMAELRKAMRSLFKRTTDKNQVTQLLNQDGLLPVLDMLPSALKAGAQKVLLVIDQFEEVFTVCPLEDERTRFIDCITAIQTLENSPLAIVTTMRADFFEACLSYSKLVDALQFQQVLLSPLQGDDLIQAIEQPAKDLGYRFAPGLLDLILEDVKAEKNCLPLLEFALTELWDQRDRDKKELPLNAYTANQRLKGALNKRAEAVYNDDLSTEAERTWAKRICLELVRIGPDMKDTRQRQPRENLLAIDMKDTRQRQPRKNLLAMGKTDDDQTLISEVIKFLVAGRLLVPTDKGEIDLAHEALMAGWLRFAGWRSKDRDRRRLIQRVRDDEKEWDSKGKDERYLLQGGLLAEVRKQWVTLQTDLTPSTRRFYELSDEQEKEQVAFLERALAESELREQALKITNLISTQPLNAAAQAIQNVQECQEKLQGHVITPVHGNLMKVFNQVRIVGIFEGHSANVWSVAFSPDGQTLVSVSQDQTVRLWDLAGNPIGEPFSGHSAPVMSVAFSPDGQTIVSGSGDQTVRLWDLAGNPIGEPFSGHSDAVLSVAFSPDGQTIVSGSGDQTVRLWDLKGNPVSKPFKIKPIDKTLKDFFSGVHSVAFSPNGKQIASGVYDGTVRLWDLKGNPIGEPFEGHSAAVRSVAFGPNGRFIVSGSDDKTLQLWDLEDENSDKPTICRGHSGIVWSVAFSPDGTRIVSSSHDQTVRLWGLEGNPIGEPLRGHSKYVRSASFSPDGKQIVSGSDDKTLRLWDLQDNAIEEPFQGHEKPVRSVVFSPDGKQIVSGSDDKTLQLWDLKGNRIGNPFIGHEGGITSVAFDPNGHQIVSSSNDQTLWLWDLDGNRIGKPFVGHEGSVTSVAFSSDGRQIVSGSDDKTLRLWDVEGNPIGKAFCGHDGRIRSVAFSPDGNYIVSGSDDETLRVWDLAGNLIGKPFHGHSAWVRSVAFSPDGNHIISGSDDKTLRVWDLAGNLISEPFRGHSKYIWSVAFSPDGKTIISGSSDETILLWDLAGNTIGDPFRGHSAPVLSVAFSPDGKAIVSGGRDGTVRLWRGGTWRDWLALCCNRFRYHPLFKNADREPFISACKVCEEYVWSQEEGGE